MLLAARPARLGSAIRMRAVFKPCHITLYSALYTSPTLSVNFHSLLRLHSSESLTSDPSCWKAAAGVNFGCRCSRRGGGQRPQPSPSLARSCVEPSSPASSRSPGARRCGPRARKPGGQSPSTHQLRHRKRRRNRSHGASCRIPRPQLEVCKSNDRIDISLKLCSRNKGDIADRAFAR